MKIDITHYSGPDEMLTECREFLENHEMENSLTYGLLNSLKTKPSWLNEETAFYGCAKVDKNIVITFFCTHPHRILFSNYFGPTDETLEKIFELILEEKEDAILSCKGANMPKPLLETFCAAWNRTKNFKEQLLKSELTMHLYALDKTDSIPPVLGKNRLATIQDLDWVYQCMTDFVEELKLSGPSSNREDAIKKIEAGSVHIWTDEKSEMATMATVGGETTNTRRIGLVYTPEHKRGHGYATGLVHEICETLLSSGIKNIGLFADVDYPPSNRVYQKVGFKPLIQFTELNRIPK